jgi:hypothetical protein
MLACLTRLIWSLALMMLIKNLGCHTLLLNTIRTTRSLITSLLLAHS